MDQYNNSERMSAALERLSTVGIRHQQPSPFQIKVGLYNFYPSKGTIYVDGAASPLPERGLENFLGILNNVRALSAENSAKARIGRPASLNDERPKGFDLSSAVGDDGENID